jgi:hypothetical protein
VHERMNYGTAEVGRAMSERGNELVRGPGGGEAGAAPGAMQHAVDGDGFTVTDN